MAQQYTRTDVAFSRQSSSGGGKKDFGEDLEIDKKLTAPLLCLTLSGVFLNDHFSRKTMLIISVFLLNSCLVGEASFC